MATCDVCGNDFDNAFTVRTAAGEELTFDSIECAAHRIAPACTHCGCRILGHGALAGDKTTRPTAVPTAPANKAPATSRTGLERLSA